MSDAAPDITALEIAITRAAAMLAGDRGHSVQRDGVRVAIRADDLLELLGAARRWYGDQKVVTELFDGIDTALDHYGSVQ